MSVAGKTVALLTSLNREQLAALTRAQRQRLSDELERVGFLITDVERAAAAPRAKTGVLASLRRGERAP
jgi:hypothetical protein